MCFPHCSNCQKDPKPLFDEEGTVVEESNSDIYIGEDLHEHADSVYLNFDVEDGILALVYENSNGTIWVWTSPEAEQFIQLCDLFGIELIH